MKTTFYLLKQSLNTSLETPDEFTHYVSYLSDEADIIKDNNDAVEISSSIYDVPILGCTELSDIFDETAVKELSEMSDKDTIELLLIILNKNKPMEISDDEASLNCFTTNNIGEVGVIFFQKNSEYDTIYQLVLNSRNWYIFKQDFLKKYPGDANEFIDSCSRCFPNLFFHKNTKSSVQSILTTTSKKIITHLRGLNDHLHSIMKDSPTSPRQEILERLSSTCSFDETASLEGDATRKREFTFNFLTDKGVLEDVCCEPHLKLCYNDQKGNNEYSTNRRIYFHEGKSHIHEGKILIGHIGQHL